MTGRQGQIRGRRPVKSSHAAMRRTSGLSLLRLACRLARVATLFSSPRRAYTPLLSRNTSSWECIHIIRITSSSSAVETHTCAQDTRYSRRDRGWPSPDWLRIKKLSHARFAVGQTHVPSGLPTTSLRERSSSKDATEQFSLRLRTTSRMETTSRFEHHKYTKLPLE